MSGARPLDSRSADAPFGTFTAPAAFARLMRFAQRAPHNALGKQLARAARAIYLWRAPAPVDVRVGDLRLRCWLDDNTCERKFVFTPWRFDPRELEALTEVLPRDGVFVDIGANVGIYTLLMATRLRGGGRIVAFEPFPPTHDRLLFNLAATRAASPQWPRVDALRLGVAGAEGKRELRLDAGNLGGGSLAPGTARFSNAGSIDHASIECRPLLAVLAELGIERVDALKIDIEGTEDEALCPFLAEAPASLLPRRVVVENSDGLWTRDLRGALAGRGYRELFRTRLNSVLELSGRARRP